MTQQQDDTSRQRLEDKIQELLASLPEEDATAVASVLRGDTAATQEHQPAPEVSLINTPRSPEQKRRHGEVMEDEYQPLDIIRPEPETPSVLVEPDSDPNALPLDSLPPKPRANRPAWRCLASTFAGNGFHRNDTVMEWVRKGGFWLALITLTACLGYVMYTMWLLPTVTASRYEQVEAMYHEEDTQTVTEGTAYPTGMLRSFTDLYDANADVRGFIRFHASGTRDFLDIDYPIMKGSRYVDEDFYGHSNPNGTPFLDDRCAVDAAGQRPRVMLVYGNNSAAGGMFSGLNELVGSPYYARSAPLLTMSTLFETHTYQVFAVTITDENGETEDRGDMRRTQFADDADFLSFVQEVRLRSLFHYPVEVTAEDELLVLSTVASPSVSKLDNARLLVYARRMPEDAYVNTVAIVPNEQVVMPVQWYVEQELPIHPYYEEAASAAPDTSMTGE
ncbi:MAG: class B sortase [Ruminococcaceae bacterium]|nr:class B sortase [Oscillospiraceae bacterium]